ncbi:MAG TPA: mechanosensitive ion channel family protein, partial [Desulfobacterales bacterium]|nr:mechanosensitive ion channel family protein [Desulfobacterales bacterium]
MEDWLPKIWALLTIYGLKVIAAIAVFIIGRWIAKALTNFTEKVMNKRQVDPTVISFVGNLLYM